MSEQFSDEKADSFSLTQQKKHQGAEDPVSWQERAYDRLKVLYRIGKMLSRFDSVEDTFPKILTVAAETFPLMTVVLVDNWHGKPKSFVWHSDKATHEQVLSATANAGEAFAYLSKTKNTPQIHRKNCIVLPLIVDGLPPMGVLQLEGSMPLDEKDLEFVDALAHLIAVALDRFNKSLITQELRNAEDKVSSQKLSDLQTEGELREGFVSLLTHDLRTPLAAAKMAAQLIKSDNAENKELVSRISSNISRADQMISRLLDANRIRSGEKLALNTEPVNLVALVKDTLTELNLLYQNRFVFAEQSDILGQWDPRSLRRMIENICSNAIKYGAPDTPVNIRIFEKNNSVQILIQNRGDIISSEDQKSIFQQYKRSRKAQGGKKQGWGIGLTLVQGVAEAHGGKVTVTSDAEAGTVFTVSLPKHS